MPRKKPKDANQGARASKRAKKLEPDNPLLIIAESATLNRSLRNLAAVGGHGGRPDTEPNPKLQWNLHPPAPLILCQPCATPNRNEPPACTTATPPTRSATSAVPLPTETPTPAGKKGAAAQSPKVAILKPSTKLEGNRILNIGKIQKAVSENMVCKECVEDRETELLNSFATHLHSMDATEIKKTSVHTLVKDYKAARKKESELSGIYINSETQFGIATSITFACHSSETNTALHDCGEVNAEEAKYFVDKKEDGQRHASRANWWYELNNKMVLAMQAIGHAGRAAGTILSFLDFGLKNLQLIALRMWNEKLARLSAG